MIMAKSHLRRGYISLYLRKRFENMKFQGETHLQRACPRGVFIYHLKSKHLGGAWEGCGAEKESPPERESVAEAYEKARKWRGQGKGNDTKDDGIIALDDQPLSVAHSHHLNCNNNGVMISLDVSGSSLGFFGQEFSLQHIPSKQSWQCNSPTKADRKGA